MRLKKGALALYRQSPDEDFSVICCIGLLNNKSCERKKFRRFVGIFKIYAKNYSYKQLLTAQQNNIALYKI